MGKPKNQRTIEIKRYRRGWQNVQRVTLEMGGVRGGREKELRDYIYMYIQRNISFFVLSSTCFRLFASKKEPVFNVKFVVLST